MSADDRPEVARLTSGRCSKANLTALRKLSD